MVVLIQVKGKVERGEGRSICGLQISWVVDKARVGGAEGDD